MHSRLCRLNKPSLKYKEDLSNPQSQYIVEAYVIWEYDNINNHLCHGYTSSSLAQEALLVVEQVNWKVKNSCTFPTIRCLTKVSLPIYSRKLQLNYTWIKNLFEIINIEIRSETNQDQFCTRLFSAFDVEWWDFLLNYWIRISTIG